jgi:hypothetical protein
VEDSSSILILAIDGGLWSASVLGLYTDKERALPYSLGGGVGWLQNRSGRCGVQNNLLPFSGIGPPLWSSGQSFWLQIQRSGFDSRRYLIFWEVLGLERGPFSLMSTIVELLERKSSGSCLENRDYGRRDPSRWPRGILYPQKLAVISPTSSGRSVGIVRSRTQATELSCRE